MKLARIHSLGLTVLLIATLVTAPLNMANAEEKKVPERSEIEKQYTWAPETIVPNLEAWEAAFAEVERDIPKLEAFKGKLGESPETLLKFLKLRDDIGPRFEQVWVYASLRADEDTRVGKYQALKDRLRGLGVKYGQATAWVEPEITSIEWDTLDQWMNDNEELAVYRQSFHDLFRQKRYILSPREEELLALAGQMRAVPYNTYNLLANADLQYPTITDAEGNEVELSDSAFYIFMRNPDRRVRKDAYEGIVGTYRNFRNTAAALVNGAVQNHLFTVRARGYDSCLTAALDGSNIPIEVYNNLVNTVNDNLYLLHRYQAIRRKALGLKDGVHAYDLFAPLTDAAKLEYTYEQAVDTMIKGLAPLGQEYVGAVKQGVDSRWVDVYPTKGKRSGAYSSGSYLTQPYILLNFHGGYEDMSTLAHEMGHSMHSHLTRHNQPYVYGDYTTFCAEVASTTNEILLQEYVLARITDPQTKLYLLGELLEGFRGTVFRQTMFSEFEQKIHEMAEQDLPLTADTMGAAYREIMTKYYGPDYTHDELVDNYWVRIPHFYYNFYVYKYATSHCAAANIGARVLEGEPGAVDAYLSFLKAGSSQYSIDLLKMARVDMTTPQPIQDAMRLFESMLDQTEELLEQVQ
ncbi:MAG: oligoendopeptidase F [Planctomycetes bacterium]|nr:oligoendopeptidase F [Planctomycetota bacterium]